MHTPLNTSLNLQLAFLLNIAGRRQCAAERPVETPKVAISRVLLKASPVGDALTTTRTVLFQPGVVREGREEEEVSANHEFLREQLKKCLGGHAKKYAANKKA